MTEEGVHRDGETGGRIVLAGLLAVITLGTCGLSGCAFCPAGLEATAADKAAGLACHFTPEQERVWEQREQGLLHPPNVSF
jgi:hypothetical protein